MLKHLTSITIAILLAGSLLTAGAEEPADPPSHSMFTGAAPAPGAGGLLVTSASIQVSRLVEALAHSGCTATTIAISGPQGWETYIPGAPDRVNDGFPSRLAAGTAFFVRCAPSEAAFTLTLLHHDGAQSALISAGTDRAVFGGIARFKTVVDRLRQEANATTDATVLISAGGNLVARPEFKASIEAGVPYYDAVGLSRIGYDAIVLGSQDFDFGPDVLENFIRSFGTSVPFISANLELSAEPGMQALADDGWIAPSATVRRNGMQIGIVGATTPELSYISSPRDVEVDIDVAGAVQREIDRLTGEGVQIIILASFLQDLARDRALLSQLRDVDIAVSGGAGDLYANPGTTLIPGDATAVQGSYPQWAEDLHGRSVPLVAAPGHYSYVGRLVVGFDADGRLTSIDVDASGPVRVSGIGSDVATPDASIQAQVVEPVQAALQELASRVIGTSEVALDTRMAPGLRAFETNAGNLLADAILWQARALAEEFGATSPSIALINSGGIRGDALIPAGTLTELQTYDFAPFASFVSIVEEISPVQLKRLLETSVSQVEQLDGRFAQVAGFSFTWDPSRPAMTVDATGDVTSDGSRVREVVLDDGTVLVRNGTPIANAPSVAVATIDFLARGGDQYPFDSAEFETLGVTYRQALSAYIREALGGRVTASDYPEGGEDRIRRE